MRILDIDEELEYLRTRRELECFTIINRGKIWYDHLTFEQRSELTDWYFAWLNVTETRSIPTKPNWLNSKLKREESVW